MTTLPDFYPALVARIRARLRPDPDHAGCLVYPSSNERHARVRFRGRLYNPHRVILEATLGRLLPRHIDACHTCDNPPCCFEEHLFEGTRAVNVHDAIAKGRLKPRPLTAQQRAAISKAKQRRDREARDRLDDVRGWLEKRRPLTESTPKQPGPPKRASWEVTVRNPNDRSRRAICDSNA